MDSKIPDTTWDVSVIPSRNPMFHKKEIDCGVGNSNRDLLAMLISGSLFIILVFFNILYFSLKILNFMHFYAITIFVY